MLLKQFSKILMTVLFAASLNVSANAQFSNQHWNAVLGQYVNKQGFVDYQSLANNRQQLDQYLLKIKTMGPNSTPELFPTVQDKLAYYINSYNALVFEGVLRRGPEEKSVCSGLISGLNFFVRMDVTLDGDVTNLKKLEDVLIREGFQDPRIHAALNCASISCPRLPQEAFEADGLDQQLDAAMAEFVNNPVHVRLDEARETAYLSKIFDWFDEDFLDYEKAQGQAKPSLLNYVNRYREEQIPAGYKVKFLNYDKGINKQ